jgi:hypothetical protein
MSYMLTAQCSPWSSPAILALTASSKPLLCEAPARAVTLQASAIPGTLQRRLLNPSLLEIFYVNHLEIIHTGGNPEFKPHIFSHKLRHLYLHLSVSVYACTWCIQNQIEKLEG